MSKHTNEYAVIGLGRFGSAVALALESQGHHVLGIEQNMDIVQSLSPYLTHVVSLDATDEEALESIDIREFKTVIVAIGTDFESNLLIAVALKELGVSHVICKTMTQRQSDILHKIGADRVILPEYEAGQRLAEELVNPALHERFHLGPEYSVAEVTVPAKFVNQSLMQTNLRQEHGINVLAVKRGDNIMTSPRADLILLNNDELVVLAKDSEIEIFSQLAVK